MTKFSASSQVLLTFLLLLLLSWSMWCWHGYICLGISWFRVFVYPPDLVGAIFLAARPGFCICDLVPSILHGTQPQGHMTTEICISISITAYIHLGCGRCKISSPILGPIKYQIVASKFNFEFESDDMSLSCSRCKNI